MERTDYWGCLEVSVEEMTGRQDTSGQVNYLKKHEERKETNREP